VSAKRKYDFDVAVIGGGSAGYAAARVAAGAGLRTVVVEGGREVGGLCILRGCMPSKSLLYAAEVRHLAQHGATWGLKPGKIGFDFRKVMQRKAEMIEDFASYRRKQLEAGKFKFIRANARFVDAHTFELLPFTSQNARPSLPPLPLGGEGRGEGVLPKVHGAHSRKLTANHFIIASGSVTSPSPLPSLTQTGYITSDHALSLKKLPKSLIVLGGGATACELAQFFARFDVAVTMLQRSAHILKEFDDDAATVVENVLRREGINLFTETCLLDVRRKGRKRAVCFRHGRKKIEVAADEILFALGRSPNTAGLDLAAAGVKLCDKRIVTNHRMQTSAPHIYAAGDCTGPHEIVHIAVQQGEIAAHNIVHPRRPRAMDYRLLSSVVFTDPQTATVGLTEKAASAHNIPFLAASYPFNDHGKSLIMEAKDGFVKLLANPKSGEILGGACVGPLGGELIHEITAAMAKRMTVHELAALPHYHPTLAEIWTYPAEELAVKIS
jgi:pyruvate/2-oxoglutarate dehydrogenase complex dihydrolipoamide dehydrogenase (E3) component